MDQEDHKQLACLIKSLIGPFAESLFKKVDANKRITEKAELVKAPAVELNSVAASHVAR